MNEIIKRHKVPILLGIFFLLTRLYNLTKLPIFTDESIYMYWAKYIGSYHSNLFISLTDGKPPLLIWLMTIPLAIFPNDFFLFAGRLISVMGGAITLVFIYKLTKLLFNSQKTALISSFLYILFPFTLFYDRLALYDSFLTAMIMGTIYFALRTSVSNSKKDALRWGIFLGLAFLTKPPAIIFLALTPLCFLIFNLDKNRSQIKNKFFLIIIALATSQLLNGLQRLSLNYQRMTDKNMQFQLPFNEFLSAPLDLFTNNLKTFFDWIIQFYTMPIFAIGIIAFVYLVIKNFRSGIILLLLWLFPILIFSTFGKIIFARYILFTTPFFLIAIGAFAKIFIDKKIPYLIKLITIAVVLFLPLRFNYLLLTDPIKAPLPKAEVYQYISSQYSGYGLEKIYKFIDYKISTGPRITLITEGKMGLFPYAFQLKYWGDPRVSVIASWIPEQFEFNFKEIQKSTQVYVVFKTQKKVPKQYPLDFVMWSKKPIGDESILLTFVREIKD